MKTRHLVSVGSLLFIGGCSIYDASLRSDLPGDSGSVESTAGAAGAMSAQVARAGPTASGEVAVLRETRDRRHNHLGSRRSLVGAGGMGGFRDGGPTRPGAKIDANANTDSGRHRATPAARPKARFRFCIRHSKNCGNVTDVDNCGSTVTMSCGVCGSQSSAEPRDRIDAEAGGQSRSRRDGVLEQPERPSRGHDRCLRW